ncbi:diguanylate cyclase (GGDEF)-like protein [Motilibacter peucedani]|uniref:Diguanylate cyclase (GGDEF)-like protein n=1 Tax=Motilibacter peucedani TaxID=598650 RepID=A0A420XK74_9ACTN|nr:bifunctional diguanylate cyclase/phosphodiesterase [Motilibacter peucedani]RKS67915.1 diguanylate cyclase (GGDEF)-like protein [Motilibacter peucedani]
MRPVPLRGPAALRRALGPERLERLAELLRPTPTNATPLKVSLVTGALFGSGGLVSLIALLFPQPSVTHVGLLQLLAVVAVAAAVGLVAVGRHIPVWAHHLAVCSGSLIITVSVLAAGGGGASLAYASLYVFIAVDTFFFYSWPVATAHTTCAVGAGAGALITTGKASAGQGVMLVGVVLAVATVTGYLANAASAAEFDVLTRLPNRRGFDRLLGDAMTAAERTQSTLLVALIDLDHFRHVNERDGSGAGDRLLRAVAKAWGPLLRPGQVLARFGGDEFALLLPSCPSDRATVIVDELRRALPEGRTASAGLAEWEPGDSASILVNRADVALYEAKRSGRDRTVHQAGDRAAAEELRRALVGGELHVYFQPIVDLGGPVPCVTGAEALVRWIHPERGTVPPLEFIPFAESSGLIREIGRHVLFEACEHAAAWDRSEGRPLKVTVNVSARELDDECYAEQVHEALERSGLPADALVLEITESTLSGPGEQAQRTLEHLRGHGVRIAIDDFGTGYSSLSRLDALPIDILKIDRSFVSPIGPTTRSAPLVAAITAMASALGLAVVAEGVEDEHQALLLASLGCGEGQGYLFGRPVPPAELLAQVEPVAAERL